MHRIYKRQCKSWKNTIERSRVVLKPTLHRQLAVSIDVEWAGRTLSAMSDFWLIEKLMCWLPHIMPAFGQRKYTDLSGLPSRWLDLQDMCSCPFQRKFSKNSNFAFKSDSFTAIEFVFIAIDCEEMVHQCPLVDLSQPHFAPALVRRASGPREAGTWQDFKVPNMQTELNLNLLSYVIPIIASGWGPVIKTHSWTMSTLLTYRKAWADTSTSTKFMNAFITIMGLP